MSALLRNYIQRNLAFIVLASICVLFMGVVHIVTQWRVLDALITFRFAENMAQGVGLVFNEGERVSGNTSLLYSVLLGMLRQSGIDTFRIATVLNLALYALSIVLMFKLAKPTAPSQAITIAVSVCFFPLLSVHAISGMETQLYLVLLLLCLYYLAEYKWKWVAAIAALMLITRPDAVIYYPVIVLVLFFHNRRQGVLLCALLFISLALYLSFNHLYYDHWIPNTILAKRVVYNNTLLENIDYLVRTVFRHRMLFAGAILLQIAAGVLGATRLVKLTAWMSLVSLLYLLGAPTIRNWYVAPYLMLLLSTGALWFGRGMESVVSGKGVSVIAGPIIVVAYAVVFSLLLLPQLHEHRKFEEATRIAPAEWLIANTGVDDACFVTALETGYHSGMRTYDWPGLVTPSVWRAIELGAGDIFDMAVHQGCLFVVVPGDRGDTSPFVKVKTYVYSGPLFFAEGEIHYSIYVHEDIANRFNPPPIADPEY
jgi:arabinofuranosyltransferase